MSGQTLKKIFRRRLFSLTTDEAFFLRRYFSPRELSEKIAGNIFAGFIKLSLGFDFSKIIILFDLIMPFNQFAQAFCHLLTIGLIETENNLLQVKFLLVVLLAMEDFTLIKIFQAFVYYN